MAAASIDIRQNPQFFLGASASVLMNAFEMRQATRPMIRKLMRAAMKSPTANHRPAQSPRRWAL